MIDALDKRPPQDRHFVIIRGDVRDIEAIGIADKVLVERLAVLDKRLWAYRKVVLTRPDKWLEVKLLLQEYLIPIICSDCPDYITQCLADLEKRQGG
jgi:hypothetical protein